MTDNSNVAGIDGKQEHVELIAEVNERANDLEGLSAAERLQIEQVRAERAAAEARRAESEAKLAEVQAQNIALRFQDNWQDAIQESQCQFYLSPQQLAKLLDGSKDADGLSLEQGGDGRVVLTKDGQRVSAKDGLRQYAIRHPEMVRNANELLLDAALVEAKADLTSTAAKSAFIAKNGLEAFERLPQQRLRKINADTITTNEWRKLTPSQKAKLITAGADVGQIMRRG